MKINNEISLVKFLKMYYNIPRSKTRYLRHKYLKDLIPELKCIDEIDFDIINRNISLGIWLRVIDCEGKIMYYDNPFYNQDKLVEDIDETLTFESPDEFKSAQIYHRFTIYEGNVTISNEEFENPLISIPSISNNELMDMDKWELLELKKKLENSNKLSMGAHYVLIARIKRELSSRRKVEIGSRRSYVKKKENRQND